MFYNNYKWSINFKNWESLYTKSVTYNIIHQPYFSKYKQEKKSGHFVLLECPFLLLSVLRVPFYPSKC